MYWGHGFICVALVCEQGHFLFLTSLISFLDDFLMHFGVSFDHLGAINVVALDVMGGSPLIEGVGGQQHVVAHFFGKIG